MNLNRIWPARRQPDGCMADSLFRWTTRLVALSVLALVALIFLTLLERAFPAFERFGLRFLISREWNPVTENFGALPAIIGTLATSVIALAISVPVSFGIAVFITELAPTWLKRPVSTAVELLAAIPSIIYGMWGLFVFAPVFAEYVQPWVSATFSNWPLIGALFSGPPLGIGIFTAGFVLAIMVTPFIASVMREVFELSPASLKESAYGLGATTWEVVWHIVLPYTKAGVVGGIMLGLGRALGETMAVTFVIGNAHDLNVSLFMPGATISSTLANEFTEAVGTIYTSSLLGLAFILFIITFVVLVLARWLLLRISGRHQARS